MFLNSGCLWYGHPTPLYLISSIYEICIESHDSIPRMKADVMMTTSGRLVISQAVPSPYFSRVSSLLFLQKVWSASR